MLFYLYNRHGTALSRARFAECVYAEILDGRTTQQFCPFPLTKVLSFEVLETKYQPFVTVGPTCMEYSVITRLSIIAAEKLVFRLR